MTSRLEALRSIQYRFHEVMDIKNPIAFGQDTFNWTVMEKMLPKNICSNLKDAVNGKTRLNPLFAQQIAGAMKEWAIKKGATHFCHWFQPQTGFSAEKQDAFIDWGDKGEPIDKFSGKQLMRGEPDASSFPHGGARSTSESRGYTAWDLSSFPFLWGMGPSKVLCIPSVFFSWTGVALDAKIPLLRSESLLNAAALRLLNLFEVQANFVYSTLGCEQEYFLVDRSYHMLRPDLMLAGRTLCGSAPAKGQELEDHYFGTINERVSAFMVDLEQRACALGIPLKTRHAEVAPGQYEFAPLFEKTSTAIDHNILLMELLRQVAKRHHLACFVHEKPFARINGSGKHCNWSLATDTGLNLFDPSGPPLVFLSMLAAVMHAVHGHATLLRASVATPGNDHRLGGHEAPPAIISVYLGQALEKWLRSVEENKAYQSTAGETLDLKIPQIPDIPLDDTDRNRTSPFAFTGNKFEFRAVGASQNCAFPMTTLNVIVARSINGLVDELEKEVLKKKPLKSVALKVIAKSLRASKAIRFGGDNYSASWQREAKKRKLPLIAKSVRAFDVLLDPKTIRAFEGVLTKSELESRVEIMLERYCKTINIEARLLCDMFQTQILPAAFQYQKEIAKSTRMVAESGHSVGASQTSMVGKISKLISQSIDAIHLLEKERQKAGQYPLAKSGLVYCDIVSPQAETARKLIDELEGIVDDRLWPFPKYREMLHIL